MNSDRSAPRYSVKTDPCGTVTLTSSDELVCVALSEYSRDSVSRTYWVADSGRSSYVHEVTDTRPGTLGQQVCQYLARRGATLTATRANLASVIRRELRLAIGAELRARGK